MCFQLGSLGLFTPRSTAPDRGHYIMHSRHTYLLNESHINEVFWMETIVERRQILSSKGWGQSTYLTHGPLLFFLFYSKSKPWDFRITALHPPNTLPPVPLLESMNSQPPWRGSSLKQSPLEERWPFYLPTEVAATLGNRQTFGESQPLGRPCP